MRTLGLVGGMSWESTASYYAWINRFVGDQLGGLHSARLVLFSVDFAQVEAMQDGGRWDEAAGVLADAARRLTAAGAEILVLCTNTMHVLAPELASAVSAPWIHIADATADAVRSEGVRRVGLLGTRYTMDGDFYRGRLSEKHGLDVLVPGEADRALVNDVIYDELCRGRVEPGSREAFRRIVDDLAARGAEGVILGCTEIGLLLDDGDASVPLFDTARIHAERAAAVALGLAGLP
jgi:aspartate racemase